MASFLARDGRTPDSNVQRSKPFKLGCHATLRRSAGNGHIVPVDDLVIGAVAEGGGYGGGL